VGLDLLVNRDAPEPRPTRPARGRLEQQRWAECCLSAILLVRMMSGRPGRARHAIEYRRWTKVFASRQAALLPGPHLRPRFYGWQTSRSTLLLAISENLPTRSRDGKRRVAIFVRRFGSRRPGSTCLPWRRILTPYALSVHAQPRPRLAALGPGAILCRSLSHGAFRVCVTDGRPRGRNWLSTTTWST
jgi:hypothetical protein